MYGVFISQLVRYSRACVQYSDFLKRAQMRTQRLHKQDNVERGFKFSLQRLYDHHHELVDRYEISIFNGCVPFNLYCLIKTFTRLEYE